jgi:hypothetical protein
MPAQRKKNIAKSPPNALATVVGYMKTIQINLGGMWPILGNNYSKATGVYSRHNWKVS